MADWNQASKLGFGLGTSSDPGLHAIVRSLSCFTDSATPPDRPRTVSLKMVPSTLHAYLGRKFHSM